MSKKPSLWVVFGTRPEAIKMLPLVHKLKTDERFDLTVCVTGQHREMLDQVMSVFNVKADIDLNVMKHGQSLSTLTVNILNKMEQAFLEHGKPDRVLVHGDTSTAFVVALSSFYHEVDVSHIEAGLRTFDIKTPFPEEANRQLVKVITDSHFSPTELPKQNLIKEGVCSTKIFVTGNTVIDALLWMQEELLEKPELAGEMVPFVSDLTEQYPRYILVTGHRRESHGEGFDHICKALEHIALSYPDVAIVYPVHLNPKVSGTVNEKLGHLPNVKLIAPQEYAPFVYLMDNAYFIMTDSGGVQEEAPSLDKPVLVMRDVTERQEAVSAGTVKLVGTKTDVIIRECVTLLDDQSAYQEMQGKENPYGDGNASARIIASLAQIYNI